MGGLPSDYRTDCVYPLPLDTLRLRRGLSHCLDRLRAAGYLEASLDGVLLTTDSTGRQAVSGEVSLHLGPRYYLSGGDDRAYTPETLRAELEGLARRDSLGASQRLEYHQRVVAPGRVGLWVAGAEPLRMPLAGLVQEGGEVLRPGVLLRLAGLRLGDSLTAEGMHAAAASLGRFPYLLVARPSAVDNRAEGATLHLYLERRAASHAEGVLALAPRQGRGGTDWAIDGDVRLLNLLRFGESFRFTFRGREGGDRHLHMSTDWPVVLSSRWGVGASFRLKSQRGYGRSYSAMGYTAYLVDVRQRVGLELAHGQSADEQTLSVESTSLGLRYNYTSRRYHGAWSRGREGMLRVSIARRRASDGARGTLLAYEGELRPSWTIGRRWYLDASVLGRGLFPFGAVPLLGIEQLTLGGRDGLWGYHDGALRTRVYGLVGAEPGLQAGRWLRLGLIASVGAVHASGGGFVAMGGGLSATARTDRGHLALRVARGWDTRPSASPSSLMLHLELRLLF
ncbi:MAG: hypothetical protein CSA07_00565 [Bacteroidia bacterium]|nr:MAG: hypothetical protein CSA07_00565 [Bacteroidia bacterium]